MIDRNEIRNRIKAEISCTRFLDPAPNYKGGNTGYICPACGSGKHRGSKSTGAVEFYPDTNKWYCHKCKAGGDVLDLFQEAAHVDYNEALTELAREIGIILPDNSNYDTSEKNDRAEGHRSRETEARQGTIPLQAETPENGAQSATEATADYTAYYEYCNCGRIADPAAIAYLTGRGISIETANIYKLGFDAAADPASAPGATGNEYKRHAAPRIIIPCTNDYYVPRSIDPATPEGYKAPNPKGSHTQLFNASALYAENEIVFICEAWADALSFIECGAPAISLNGKGNGQLLIDQLEKQPAKVSFVICLDDDAAEKAVELEGKLLTAGYNAIIYNVIGKYHDANDALKADRAQFKANIATAIDAARANILPGLLTYETAVFEFQNSNDEILEMDNFPEFCKRAKIKLHDTVAIAADTGAGKSSLALNFINDLNDRYPVIYVNLEMDAITILRRLVAINTGIELDRIEGYQQDERTAADVNNALKVLTARQPLQILKNTYNLADIEKEIQRATVGRADPTIVVVDHSLLVETNSNFSRYERFTHISETLRKISRTYNIIMFVLLQQNREGKKDEEKEPDIFSLKESGSWENDSTHIVFLWYDPKAGRKKLLIKKNRSGENGKFTLDYYRKTQIYREGKNQLQADSTNIFDHINRL